MPRQARLETPGTLHHVIVRGIEERRIVDDRKGWENFVKRMGEIASDISTTVDVDRGSDHAKWLI